MSDNKNNQGDAPVTLEEAVLRLNALEGIVTDQAEKIEELATALAEKTTSSVKVSDEPVKKPEIPEKTFKHGGEEYRFKVAKFRIDGIVYLAEEAINDKAVCKTAAEDYPGLLEKVS